MTQRSRTETQLQIPILENLHRSVLRKTRNSINAADHIRDRGDPHTAVDEHYLILSFGKGQLAMEVSRFFLGKPTLTQIRVDRPALTANALSKSMSGTQTCLLVTILFFNLSLIFNLRRVVTGAWLRTDHKHHQVLELPMT